MSALLENDKYEKLHAYFLELKKEVEKTRLNFSTGNESLDILFNSKAHEAMKNNITTDIKSFINLPEDFLKNVDAVSIFGNILNNAIEACMAVNDEKSRFINRDNTFEVTIEIPRYKFED